MKRKSTPAVAALTVATLSLSGLAAEAAPVATSPDATVAPAFTPGESMSAAPQRKIRIRELTEEEVGEVVGLHGGRAAFTGP